MRAALLAFSISAVLSLGFAYVPALGGRFARVAPGPRWRSDAVPLAGGLAMAAGFGVAVAVFGRSTGGAWAVLAAGGTALLVGLVDDLRSLPPVLKLAGQVGAGVVLAAAGVRFTLPGPGAAGWAATVGWVVLAANAVNLFDNVDAVAAGAALTAGAALWLWWVVGWGPTPLAAALVGGVAGFLVLNLPPARLFMGDAGSHFLGVVLAALTIQDGGRAGSAGPAPSALVVLVPLVLLAIPLFDTGLVAVERVRHRRPLMAGGRDHTSHRLLAIGMGAYPVAGLLTGLTGAAAAVATLAMVGWPWLAAGAVALAAGLTVLGIRLARVPVYG